MRPGKSYRAARRNEFLIDPIVSPIRARKLWRLAPLYSIIHKVMRRVPILNAQTKMPEIDKKTGEVKTEMRQVQRIQVVHHSYTQTVRP